VITIPGYVKTQLFHDEEVIGKTTNTFQDLYATNLRILNFVKPTWWIILLWVGILPGLMAFILVNKSFMGSLEYSKISGIKVTNNRKRIIAGGLLGGLLFIIVGIAIVFLILAVPDESVHSTAYIGVFFIILGIVTGSIILTRKTEIWQIQLKDNPGQDPTKWRVTKDISTANNEFLKIIQGKSGINVS
jgi:hypothetical protein